MRARRRWLRPESIGVRWLVVLATVIGAVAAAVLLDRRPPSGGTGTNRTAVRGNMMDLVKPIQATAA